MTTSIASDLAKLIRSEGLEGVLKILAMYIALALFLYNAVLWLSAKRITKHSYRSMEEIVHVFYIEFLRLKPSELVVEKIDRYRVVAISRNRCPILELSRLLKIDTRILCRFVSETVCRFVLRSMDRSIGFERDYSYIRPYRDGCREIIYLRRSA